MACVPDTYSTNQLVSYNLMRIRKALGLSQEQAAEQLEPYLGVRWSKAVYSTAERSYIGKRVRQFTSAELAAFALAFGVRVLYFFLPPKPEHRTADAVMIGGQRLSWPDLFEVMVGGKQRSAIQPRLAELPAEDQPATAQMREELRLIAIGWQSTAAFDARLQALTDVIDREIHERQDQELEHHRRELQDRAGAETPPAPGGEQ